MDDADIDARFAIAASVMAEAAALALQYNQRLETLTIESKGPQDLVSEADREVEMLIRERIGVHFPEDDFVGEELGSKFDGVGVWVVDPIDGTQDFLLGFPTWCVSIAFVANDELVFGLITSPVTGDRYAARKGEGATWNGQVISASPATSLKDGVTSVGYSTKSTPSDLAHILDGLTTAGGVLRSVGSGALMIVWVATGQCIGYVEMYINAWDCLAALCIVKEAGGRSNDFLAENGPAGNGRIVVAAPALYTELESLLPTKS